MARFAWAYGDTIVEDLAPTESLATRRRRWLLAMFGRMMARFYTQHQRKLSLGRWSCRVCHRRIFAWGWRATPPATVDEVVHDACVSRSIWDIVQYYDYLVQQGFGPPKK